jgi:hypothetical protein
MGAHRTQELNHGPYVGQIRHVKNGSTIHKKCARQYRQGGILGAVTTYFTSERLSTPNYKIFHIHAPISVLLNGFCI